MTELLRLNNVTMKFGGLTCVDKLDAYVNQGELAGMIGPNGAGKTTVFNMITGVYKPTEGEITFEGSSIIGKNLTRFQRWVSAERFRISDCFQA